MQYFGRFQGEADINRQTKPAGSVDNDLCDMSRTEIPRRSSLLP
jgi:hypothetical protein